MNVRAFSIAFMMFAIVGCGSLHGPVKEVDAYIAVKEPLFEEIFKTIQADPTDAGVDKAVKLWDGKKADLKAKYDAIQAAPQGKNSDWQAVYFKSQNRTKDELHSMAGDLEYKHRAPDSTRSKFGTFRKDVETTLNLK